MRFKFIYILVVLPTFLAAQQDFLSFLKNIETNNKTLLAAERMAEVEVLEAKTGIYLSNPDISYDRLVGNTSNYSEMLISQSFDFPTTYLHKRNIGNRLSEQAFAEYRQTKINTLSEAAEYYTQAVLLNKKLKLFDEFDSLMQILKKAANRKLEVGEINVLENNRILVESAKSRVESNILKAERRKLHEKITMLNGGRKLELKEVSFTIVPELKNTDSLLAKITAKHPKTLLWKNELELSERNVSLQKSNGLPKFEIGYRQDINTGETFQGIHAGVTIPLFENKNTVRLAKAKNLRASKFIESEQLELENTIGGMILEYEVLMNAVNQLKKLNESLNTPEILALSYQLGQISYSEFFVEFASYRQTLLYINELNQKAIALKLRLYILLNY